MIVKICGITNFEDAQHSLECGANALGFNFYKPSPRYIEPGEADSIMRRLPRQIMKVGIVVVDHNGSDNSWEKLALDTVQFYGLQTPDQIPRTQMQVWVATSPDSIREFPDHRVLLDTSWGRGLKEDWEALRHLDRGFILSGGLTPENVQEAVRLLQPEGVDVCSGVESSPGVKDPGKIARFIRNAWGQLPQKIPAQGELP